MAARVHTVCGPIGPEKLGFTHTHEHIVCDGRMTHRTDPPTRGGYMLLDDQARAVELATTLWDDSSAHFRASLLFVF